MRTVSVAEFKRRFSELVAEVRYKGERVIVRRRNTPVAALVGLEELERLGPASKTAKGRGLLGLVGAWADLPEMERIMDEVYASRQHAVDRPVPPLEA